MPSGRHYIVPFRIEEKKAAWSETEDQSSVSAPPATKESKETSTESAISNPQPLSHHLIHNSRPNAQLLQPSAMHLVRRLTEQKFSNMRKTIRIILLPLARALLERLATRETTLHQRALIRTSLTREPAVVQPPPEATASKSGSFGNGAQATLIGAGLAREAAVVEAPTETAASEVGAGGFGALAGDGAVVFEEVLEFEGGDVGGVDAGGVEGGCCDGGGGRGDGRGGCAEGGEGEDGCCLHFGL